MEGGDDTRGGDSGLPLSWDGNKQAMRPMVLEGNFRIKPKARRGSDGSAKSSVNVSPTKSRGSNSAKLTPYQEYQENHTSTTKHRDSFMRERRNMPAFLVQGGH